MLWTLKEEGNAETKVKKQQRREKNEKSVTFYEGGRKQFTRKDLWYEHLRGDTEQKKVKRKKKKNHGKGDRIFNKRRKGSSVLETTTQNLHYVNGIFFRGERRQHWGKKKLGGKFWFFRKKKEGAARARGLPNVLGFGPTAFKQKGLKRKKGKKKERTHLVPLMGSGSLLA